MSLNVYAGFSVPCTACGARVGQGCRTYKPTKRRRGESACIHIARVRALRIRRKRRVERPVR